MRPSKLHNLFGIAVVTIFLTAIPYQSQAKSINKHKTQESSKERLVLMPLRVPEEDKNLTGAMETALVEGLQLKYDVYSGEVVAKKAREIYLKINKATAVNEHCDETRCMQNIAEAFQAELIATANVSKQDGTYFLALSIQNIFDNKVVYSKSLPCEGCKPAQVVEKLKELSGVLANAEADDAALAAARKAKAEQIKQNQLALDEKLRNADAAERKKLLAAQSEDEKQLAELKAQAEARHKSSATQQSGVFPTVQSAVVEIKRLKDRIASIEAGYEKELAQTRKKISQRYADQLAVLDKAQPDEFEVPADFKTKQEQKRDELKSQRDEELARLNVTTLAAAETSPLSEKIASLSVREYAVSAESLAVKLETYDPVKQQFPVGLYSKIPLIQWTMTGSVPLVVDDAKLFKQHWLAGLVRVEAKMKPTGEVGQVTLVDDADNIHLEYENGVFKNNESVLWQQAQSVNTVQSIQTYLDKYPTGNYVVVAKEKLRILEAAAKEKLKTLESVNAKLISRIAENMIRISDKNYEMGKYDVTQAEWEAVMGGNPSHFSSCGDNCPIESISWNDVQKFIQKLNAKTGKQYRLPNDEEWEFACYGGNKTEYCGGNDLNSVAWYADNSNTTTHPVGQKQANGYGLYDMSGNVWQWMQNEYSSGHALRGGSWFDYTDYLRAAFRNYDFYGPTFRLNYIGFRLARTLP